MNENNITRRDVLKGMAAGAAAAAFGGMLPDVTFAAKQKPNIIYILLDDAGYGDLGCYGQRLFETPNIDTLAAEGIRFTSHYSGCTVCAPSRCCLMTGLHTGHAVVRGNREAEPEGQFPLPEGTVTLPRLLQGAGYKTGAFGKWGLGAVGNSGNPMNHGLDEFFGYTCQHHAHGYYPDYLWHNNEKVELDGKTYSHDLIVQQAMEFIKGNAGSPFFCYMPVTIPHAALEVPDESWKPFDKKFKKFRGHAGIYNMGEMIMNPPAHFAGMMTRLDGQVGQLMALLKELGIDDNTMVMLSSDNGPHKEGGHRPDLFHSNGPFRGYKRDLYEGGIRIPMIARMPGAVQPGTETPLPSAFWDVMPTMCELAGTDAPDGIDGISFLSTLRNRPRTQIKHDYLYWEFHEQGGKQAVRRGKWKAIRQKVSQNPDAPIELYNLEEDPGETTDLSEGFKDVVAEMKEIFAAAHTDNPDFKLFEV